MRPDKGFIGIVVIKRVTDDFVHIFGRAPGDLDLIGTQRLGLQVAWLQRH